MFSKLIAGAAIGTVASYKTENDMSNHWAVLVAGSKSYYNYRHQADTCHAY